MDRQRRIAICYYGLSYNLNNVFKSNVNSAEINCFWTLENHKKILWEPNKADVFFHTWENEKIDDIVEYFNPKLWTSDPVIDFNIQCDDISDDKNLILYKHRTHILSRWYSNKKVIELKERYESENNFKYDVVLLTRFDSIYRGDWCLNDLDNQFFYVTGGWPENYEKYLPDVWFISNSEYIDKLGKVYDEMFENFHDNSDCLVNDWNGHAIPRRHLVRHKIDDKIRQFKNHYSDSNILRYDSEYTILKNKLHYE